MYLEIEGGLVPIKAWTEGVPFEAQARLQLIQTAQLPIVHPHIAVMPDVHLGIGATVGSVIPTRRAIIPAAVGVDIGCGMAAVRTTLKASDLPDNCDQLLFDSITKGVPVGQASWQQVPNRVNSAWGKLAEQYKNIVGRHQHSRLPNAEAQLGTLGSGNHFSEVSIDQNQSVWFVLHSGSRGIGNRLGSHFIDLAKKDMERQQKKLPNRDLAYLEEGSEHFDAYIDAVGWAQNYARVSRELMIESMIEAARSVGLQFSILDKVIDCHHNYVEQEDHFGESLYLTRKGAVRARVGDLGIIPGSMGTRSYIVRGKGNPDSFNSCSHGAGRVMARGVAKRTISLEQHQLDTNGVVCRKDSGVIDESPSAYKSIEAVMAAQSDLVEILFELKQIVSVKG